MRPKELTVACNGCSIGPMAYPGDRSLDSKVQQRILAAFGEAVRLYREQHPEEARTILRSIGEVDPRFIPAQRLDMAIEANAPVNLSELLGEISAAAPVSADEIVTRAKEALAAGDFQGALVLTQNLLRDLPGHAEGRRLALEAQNQLRLAAESQAQRRRESDGGIPEAARESRPSSDRRERLSPPTSEVPPPGGVSESADDFAVVGGEGDDFQFEFLDEGASEAGSPLSQVPLRSGPPPVVTPPSRPPEQGGGLVFDNRSGAAAPDFGPTGATSIDESVFLNEESVPGAGRDERVRALLEAGSEAFSRGAYQEAIDTWSRVFLIDARHGEAERLIEQARRRREEVERLAEHNFYEAREAFDRGDWDEARRYCAEVLKLQPQHFEAHDLLQRLETPAAPPPPSSQALAVDDGDDIFRDDFVRTGASAPAPAKSSAAELTLPSPRRPAERAPRFSLRTLPMPLLVGAAAVAVIALLIAGVFLVGGKIFSGGGGAVADALAEAERLVTQDRLQDAINLLQSLDVEGPQGQEITQRVLELRRQLKTRPTPPPALDTTRIREAIASGKRLTAMSMVREARSKAPGSPELDALNQELALYSPALAGASEAVEMGQWDLARQRIAQIVRDHPEDGVMQQAWEAATYNHSIALLKKYEIAAANAVLTELVSRSRDEQTSRLKDLATSYLSRSIDPRYEIFVSALEFRRVE